MEMTDAQRKELKQDVQNAINLDAYQQLERDVRVRGVIWNFRKQKRFLGIKFGEGKLLTGIIRKGDPICSSINKDNIPPYRCMTKKERKTL